MNYFGGDDSHVLFPGNVLEAYEGLLSYHVGGDGSFQGVNDEDIYLGMFLGFFDEFDCVPYLGGHAHVSPSVPEIYGVLVEGEVGHVFQAFVEVIHIGLGRDEEHLLIGVGCIEGNLAEGFEDIGEGGIGNDVYLASLEGEGIHVFILENGAFRELGAVLVGGFLGDYRVIPTWDIGKNIRYGEGIFGIADGHLFSFFGENYWFLWIEYGEGLVLVA